MPNSLDGKGDATPDDAHEATSKEEHQSIQVDKGQSPAQQSERSKLLAHGRTFLASPQVLHQDMAAKRRFLTEKGLLEYEIDALIREFPPSTLTVPPRTYPQPPPSNLPNLILGLTRVFSWLLGGSTFLLFIYWRFLLPRITRTYAARRSLKSHYGLLLQRLTSSLAAFKESQAESYSVLPRQLPYREPTKYSHCQTLGEIMELLDETQPNHQEIPAVTLLRVGIAELDREKEGESAPTTEELFRYLENKISWLLSEEGAKYEQVLWETLSTCPLFQQATSIDSSDSQADEISTWARWLYRTPEPPVPSVLQESLTSLATSLPETADPQGNKYQHTMQTLTNFTGYLSTQIYLPYRSAPGPGAFMSGSSLLSPAEEELRREIRALKGLVLNRKSFMSTVPRANSFVPQIIPR
ncbi:hypothetical protein AX17_001275 [Amanita inopinata Kibby_2008]|nr:hypothetical protein AX17_001275 [Amanita inopinata Kibby_2008]